MTATRRMFRMRNANCRAPPEDERFIRAGDGHRSDGRLRLPASLLFLLLLPPPPPPPLHILRYASWSSFASLLLLLLLFSLALSLSFSLLAYSLSVLLNVCASNLAPHLVYDRPRARCRPRPTPRPRPRPRPRPTDWINRNPGTTQLTDSCPFGK